MVEDNKRVDDNQVSVRALAFIMAGHVRAVEAMKITLGKVDHIFATWPKQPPLPAAVNS
jgi:hypothetical protein